MHRDIKVKAPGSSANLGPGFDCLGVALSRYVQASNSGDGAPCDENSIIRAAYLKAGGEADVWFSHNLEPGRGLGFSAAARAVGAAVGFLEKGATLEECRDDIYNVTCELEGHCDNAAPAVYGGFNVVCDSGARKMNVKGPNELLLWIASQQSSTDKSRKAISETVELKNAVHNISNAAALVSCLYEGDYEALGKVVCDVIHQEQRLDAAPMSAKAFEIGKAAGAQAAWLSGAGPSVAFVAPIDKHEAIIEALPDEGLAITLAVDNSGVVEV